MSGGLLLPAGLSLRCILPALAALTLFLTAFAAAACTENRVLDLVGRLEAPQGYDTVYSGVRVPPPRPITTMRVVDVLDWQRRTVRTSVSSAAGRYQIIRPTLQRLVNEGVVSPSARFDAATQDRLGRHLLRETGYRAGDTSVTTANRIARVWAALPDLSSGQSAYEGIAGNHALITSASWRGVLDCSLSVAAVAVEVATIRAGARFGFAWDRALEEMAEAADRIMTGIVGTATSLLLGLFVVDLVLRAGKWIVDRSLSDLVSGLVPRLLVVCLCLGVLMAPDALSGVIQRLAFTIGGDLGGGDVRLEDFASGRMVLVFSLFEGLMTQNAGIRASVQCMALLIVMAAAAQIGILIYWTLNLVLVGAAGLLALGFAGLKETTGAAKAYIRHLIGAGLALLTALLVMATTTGAVWNIRGAVDFPFAAAAPILLLEVVAAILMWALPQSVAKLAGGPHQKHINPVKVT